MTDNPFHQNGSTDIFFNAIYNSKSGVASFDPIAKTCFNISCHGGPRTQTQAQAVTEESTPVQTPSWNVGSIEVAAQCASCHVFDRPEAAEYNSYNSGDHFLHVWDPTRGPNPKLGCEVCHDALALAASHFAGLNTSAMEKPLLAAINTALQYNGTTGTCNPQAGGLTGCHNVKIW
jgi:predicted CxxxxCH...CXXCH cytochrome family protein